MTISQRSIRWRAAASAWQRKERSSHRSALKPQASRRQLQVCEARAGKRRKGRPGSWPARTSGCASPRQSHRLLDSR
eukprot:1593041-Prymnesium_polylepis.1